MSSVNNTPSGQDEDSRRSSYQKDVRLMGGVEGKGSGSPSPGIIVDDRVGLLEFELVVGGRGGGTGGEASTTASGSWSGFDFSEVALPALDLYDDGVVQSFDDQRALLDDDDQEEDVPASNFGALQPATREVPDVVDCSSSSSRTGRVDVQTVQQQRQQQQQADIFSRGGAYEEQQQQQTLQQQRVPCPGEYPEENQAVGVAPTEQEQEQLRRLGSWERGAAAGDENDEENGGEGETGDDETDAEIDDEGDHEIGAAHIPHQHRAADATEASESDRSAATKFAHDTMRVYEKLEFPELPLLLNPTRLLGLAEDSPIRIGDEMDSGVRVGQLAPDHIQGSSPSSLSLRRRTEQGQGQEQGQGRTTQTPPSKNIMPKKEKAIPAGFAGRWIVACFWATAVVILLTTAWMMVQTACYRYSQVSPSRWAAELVGHGIVLAVMVAALVLEALEFDQPQVANVNGVEEVRPGAAY
ncbi:Hypothetical predicted protein [Lecanosticta acicola]|uniref:Transmembrane protein n=1 Tax=Lecanosticta acicola TaxID=111012 RepID=A0AAI8Z8E2_9PEZI|nr:Hypothetical predicted protein [Lecanosticta acicola]